MTLNLPLLYFVWSEEYCHTSPNKNKSPNLLHVTSILVCFIFEGNFVAGVYHAFIVHEPSQNKQGIQVSALLLKEYFPYKNHFEFCSTFLLLFVI